MAQKIYEQDETLNNIVYKEMMQKAKENPFEGEPVDSVKEKMAESYKVDFNGRKDFHPVQKLAFADISLIQKAKISLLEVEKSIKRLRELGIDAMRNISASERSLLDEEYQYLKKNIETIGKETRVGDISILDIDPETLTVKLHEKTRSVLGSSKFLFSNENEQELEEDAIKKHGIQTGREAASSIGVLRAGLQGLNALNGALTAVENRLVMEIKDFTFGGRGREIISQEKALSLGVDVAGVIHKEAMRALASQDAMHLEDLRHLL